MSSNGAVHEELNAELHHMGYKHHFSIEDRADQIEDDLKAGKEFPFPDVIRASVSDPQGMGQQQITFVRQVIAACAYPQLIETGVLPEDVGARARLILDHCVANTIGSLSFGGISIVRQHIAEYISHRDNVQTDPQNVFITSGVFHGLSLVLNMMKSPRNGKPLGALSCVPQYMIYPEFFRQFDFHEIHYYLNEENGWTHDTRRMQRALEESRPYCDPRCLAIVNPANPTGTVLSWREIEDIVRFAHNNKLALVVDEIYEHNIYRPTCKFHSFRKVMHAMGEPWSRTELFTFNSISKGYIAEAGLQCGYFEVVNLRVVSRKTLLQVMHDVLPSSLGQVALDCLVKPPIPGEPSYQLYSKERKATLDSLAERAKMVEDYFNGMKGCYCSPVNGGMTAYPRITIPQRAVEESKRRKMMPDYFYAMELLEKTGSCVTAGCSFGQLPGTFHLRLTTLPPKHKLREMLERIKAFHEDFLEKYGGQSQAEYQTSLTDAVENQY